jgi:putative PIN family toxin of toxin-antitoxin system
VAATSYRIILDTNIVVRGFINLQSASGQILMACQRRQVIPLLSRAVLSEFRSVLRRPAILERYPELDHPHIGDAIERLLYVSEFHRRVGVHFRFPRDPKDSSFLELAIAASATHLITTDQDMLSLVSGRDDASKRFRQRTATRVQSPEDFLSEHADAVVLPR